MKVCAKCGNPYHGYDVCENCGSIQFKEIGGAHRNNGVVLDGSVINNTANSAQDNWAVRQGAEAGAYNNVQHGAYNNVMPNVQYGNIGNAENNVNANTPHQNGENNMAGVNAPQSGGNSGAVAKEKAPMSQKTVIITAVVAFVLALLLAVAGWFIYTLEVNKIELITDTVTVEYGEKPVIEDYVELTDIFTAENTKIGWDLLEISTVTDEETGEETEVPAIGEHEIVIRHNVEYSIFGHVIYSTTKEETVTLVVKEDITAPVFADDTPTTVEVPLNSCYDIKSEDILEGCFGDYVTDESEVTFRIDEDKVDYESGAGTCETTLYATDEYGNTSEMLLTVVLVEPAI